MLREATKKFAAAFGMRISSADRFGFDMIDDLRRLLADRPPVEIFDIGANVGQTAHKFSREFPAARIHCFEPAPGTFVELKRNTAALPQVTAYNQALGAAIGTATMHLSAQTTTSSLVGSTAATGPTTEVAVNTVDAFCAAQHIEHIDLLKVDVEGFESQVIAGAAAMLHGGRIRFLYLECSFVPTPQLPHGDFFDLFNALSPLGYCLVCVYPESFSLAAGSLLCNALFAQKPSLPTSVPGAIQNIA